MFWQVVFFSPLFIFLKTNKNNRLNKIYSRHMQSLCTLLLLIRSAQLSTKNANTTGRWGGVGGTDAGERRPKKWGRGQEQGSRDEEGRKRGKDKERPKLFYSGERKKKKITEYIDFFNSLHHLYKYIESQKRNKTNLREKKRNTETHNSSKANRKQEERESSDRRSERRERAEEKRETGGGCGHGEKEGGGGAHTCAHENV